VAFNLLLFTFRYFNVILSSHVSFLFHFLLVFVLLIEGKGSRCSDGEFDSCAIYTHVTFLREGALPLRPLGVNNDFQLFNPDHPLTFLHGRHRIKAARKFFTGNDRWWIADLYSDGL
jgi:hypothetical protein